MSKEFKEYLSKLQTDKAAICLEYLENQAEDIYIYCSYEPEMYAFDVFYKINGQVVLKNNLNNAVH
ncbi:YesN/AraC family two-component response regulator [Peribacillus cavernae]|nr:YesN/AraC family two-component response regulator [Peribacillus cavernae]